MNHRKIRVAFNGFGCIGTQIFRLLWGHPLIEIVGAWVLQSNSEMCAGRLRHDPHHGFWEGHRVEHDSKNIIIDGRPVFLRRTEGWESVFQDQSWDVLIECSDTLQEDPTGRHDRLDKWVGSHKKVIFTYPTRVANTTIVMGVNYSVYKPEYRIISNASCTTNCAAPILRALLDNGLPLQECSGITVHAATGKQKALTILGQILDYTTGASKTLDRIIPELRGKMHMTAVRVPTANVSYLQLACVFGRSTDVAEIRAALCQAAEGPMKGIIGLSSVELPKTDTSGFYKKNPHSAVVNLSGISGSPQGMIRVISAWYDNEYAYSCRVRDLLFYIAEREGWITSASHEHVDEYIPCPEKQYYE